MRRHILIVLTGIALCLSGTQVSAAPRYSDWSAPVNLGAIINSSASDLSPALSKDGLSLYITSTRPAGLGGEDIWVSQRASQEDAWGAPVNLGAPVNTGANERSPSFSRDGHWMFFGSTRSPGFGLLDQWVSWRPNVHDDFGWETPTNLGPNINTASNEPAATFFENDEGGAPLLYFTSNKPGGTGDFDLYVSAGAPDGSWGTAVEVVELNSPAQDARPSIRFDGLEIFFHSGRSGSAGFDLWSSTRATTSDSWSPPTNLGSPPNGGSDDFQPFISADRETLVFSSNRPGGVGLADLYMSTRTKVHGAP